MLATVRDRYTTSYAWPLNEDALQMQDHAHIGNAPAKVWGATQSAAAALMLVPERTGERTGRTTQATCGIRALGRQSEALTSAGG